MSVEKSHNDIFRRLEKVEIDVAVLDSKSNRLHMDITDLKKDFNRNITELKAESRKNGEIARRTNTLVIAVPTILSIVYGAVMFFSRVQI